jgi:hypothetical protein
MRFTDGSNILIDDLPDLRLFHGDPGVHSGENRSPSVPWASIAHRPRGGDGHCSRAPFRMQGHGEDEFPAELVQQPRQARMASIST